MSEAKIVEIVKKQKIENMILKFVLIITCLITILLNLREYRTVIFGIDPITSYSELNDAITNKYKFVNINLEKAKETRFSLQTEDGEEKSKVYEINYGDYNLLLVLTKNTVLTGNLRGEILKENDNVKTIKKKLIEDSDNKKKYIKSYFSNMDYLDEESLTKNKFYITIVLILVILFSMILDLIKFLNPKKTRAFKRYIKKMKKI